MDKKLPTPLVTIENQLISEVRAPVLVLDTGTGRKALIVSGLSVDAHLSYSTACV